MKGKLTNFEKLLKPFEGKTTSVLHLFKQTGVLPIIFVLYSKDLLVFVLFLFIL